MTCQYTNTDIYSQTYIYTYIHISTSAVSQTVKQNALNGGVGPGQIVLYQRQFDELWRQVETHTMEACDNQVSLRTIEFV